MSAKGRSGNPAKRRAQAAAAAQRQRAERAESPKQPSPTRVPDLPVFLPPARDPLPGVGFQHVLSPGHRDVARSAIGLLLALIAFMVLVPVIAQGVLGVGWLARGRPGEFEQYQVDAMAFHYPEGLVASHLALGVLLLVSLELIRRVHQVRRRWGHSVQPGVRWTYLLACAAIAVVVLNAVLLISTGMPAIDPQQDWPIWLLVIVLTSPLQAAGEEYFFRGYLLQSLGAVARNPWFAIVTSALVFALFHGTQNLPLFIDRLGFGLLAGTLVVLTGGLEAAVAAHVINNLSAFSWGLFTGSVASLRATTAITWGDAARDLIGYGLCALLAWLLARRWKLAVTTPEDLPLTTGLKRGAAI